jgi:hypothetical protein
MNSIVFGRAIIAMFFFLVSYFNEAQVLLKGDSIYFGPCMKLSSKVQAEIEYDYCSYDLSSTNGNYATIRLWLDYDDLFEKKSAEKCLDRSRSEWDSGPVFKPDSVKMKPWRSFEANGLIYQINKGIEYYRARTLGGKRRDEEYFTISIDTVIYDSVHLFVRSYSSRRRDLKRDIKLLRTIQPVAPENFPTNPFCTMPDSSSSRFIEVSVDKAQLKTTLPCTSLEQFKKDYANYYTSDMDNMFGTFDYGIIADTLYKRMLTQGKNKWNCEKEALIQMFDGLDATVQNEIRMHQRLYRNEINISDYVNHFKGTDVPTYFDTLDLIRFRQLKLSPIVQPSSAFVEECESDMRFKSLQMMHSNIGMEEKNENVLLSFIAKKYLYSKLEKFNCTQLHNSENRLIYLFESIDSNHFKLYIANISQEPVGKWSIDVEVLDNINYGVKLDSMFYFNGITAFVVGNDFLITDQHNSEVGSSLIKSFPDSLPDFNYITLVKSPEDLFENRFQEEEKFNYPNNDFRRKHPLAYAFDDMKKRRLNIRGEYDAVMRGDYAATEAIYLHSGSGDLDGDGVSEIYSYGISNGKVIFVQGYTVQNTTLVPIISEEIVRKLQYCILFKDMILYSQFAHGGN